MTTRIYSDGACSGNPGPGGWAAVILKGEEVKEISGFLEHSDNTKLEMTACIKALEQLTEEDTIELYTDCLVTVEGMTTYLKIWKETNWKNGAVKNIDLWQRLDELNTKLSITWKWVKSHSGDYWNNYVDRLAKSEYRTRHY